uniref:Uncharacterized protein n=1 Tax=Oryza nivara TaxID=4536 RepID=A0A0E0HE87_ORYNI
MEQTLSAPSPSPFTVAAASSTPTTAPGPLSLLPSPLPRVGATNAYLNPRLAAAASRLLVSFSPPRPLALPPPEQAAGVPGGSEEGSGGAFLRRPRHGLGVYRIWGSGPQIWRCGRQRGHGQRWLAGPHAAAEVVGRDRGAGVGERRWLNCT